KTWKIRPAQPGLQLALNSKLGIHPLLAQLLINRGITSANEAKDFISPDLSRLHSSEKLKDLCKAVSRIRKAGQKKEKVLIFSDYDCDGITACVLLRETLEKLGIASQYYIPHRVNEGYGLNGNAASIAKECQASLLISVDCGVTAFKEIVALNQSGCEVIVIDHHETQKEKLPAATAIIDPKRPDCAYPFKELASVGLVYKLAQALLEENLKEELDLVALGTISDVMSLTGENRILVKVGLEQIGKSRRPGIRALLETSGLKNKEISVGMVGFVLGPRINACGRIDSAEKAMHLLSAKEINKALKLAKDLEEQNRQRQKIQEQVLSEALSLVEKEVNFRDHNVIVLSREGWHPGVLGIVAARITEKFYRPTIVISLEEGKGRGSGRSIERFHLFEALKNCAHFLEEFGGHSHAAGLTIAQEKIDPFRKMLNEFAKLNLLAEDLLPTLSIDAQVPLSMLSVELVRDLEKLAPFGAGNPQPVLCSCGLTVKSAPQLMGKETIKFWVSDGKLTCQVVGFGRADLIPFIRAEERVNLAYTPSIDDWQDEPLVQLELKDVKTLD
ncbi:MAG: single-stranded-DNA-specific exonuclease RecJ, partial [Candidatus Omnitrophota bacterium]